MDKARDPKFLKRRRIRRILFSALAIVALAAVSLAVSRLKPAPPTVDGGSVWPDQVKQGTIELQVHGLGTLVPVEVRTIPAITDGRVVAIPVLPGTPVKPDTILVQLANPTVEKALTDAKNQLVGAESDLTNLKASLQSSLLDQQSQQANLQAEYEQAKLLSDADAGLLAKGLVAQIDAQTDTSKAAALKDQVALGKQRIQALEASNEAQIASQETKLEVARGAVQLAQQQVDDLTVRSGIDGLLEDLDMGNGAELQVGQYVTAGTAVARVVQPNKLKAQVKIAETEVGQVAIGQSASVDTHNGIVPGHVMRIDPNSQNGTVTVDVALDGPLPPGARPDLSVDGVVNIETLKDVVYVGRPAFGQPDQTVSMFKISPDGSQGTRVKVELGKASVNAVVIRRGLNVGDWVVLSDTTAQDGFDHIRFSPAVAQVH